MLADLRDVQIVFRLKKAQFLNGDKLFVEHFKNLIFMTKGTKVQVMLLVGEIVTILVSEWLKNRDSSCSASCDKDGAIPCDSDTGIENDEG